MKFKNIFLLSVMSIFVNVNAVIIRRVAASDTSALLQLYTAVAEDKDSGLARSKEEITEEYIAGLVTAALSYGLMLVALDEESGLLVGAVSKYSPPVPASLRHCFRDGTTLVHPEFHRRGIGSALWARFLEIVRADFPSIARIELFVRASNTSAVKLYERIGFKIEGRLVGRILDTEGSLEDDLIMGMRLKPIDYFTTINRLAYLI